MTGGSCVQVPAYSTPQRHTGRRQRCTWRRRHYPGSCLTCAAVMCLTYATGFGNPADGTGLEEQRAPRSGRVHPAVQPQHQHQVHDATTYRACDCMTFLMSPVAYGLALQGPALQLSAKKDRRHVAMGDVAAAPCCAAGWQQRTWCCRRALAGSCMCGATPSWRSARSCATATRACFRTLRAPSGALFRAVDMWHSTANAELLHVALPNLRVGYEYWLSSPKSKGQACPRTGCCFCFEGRLLLANSPAND